MKNWSNRGGVEWKIMPIPLSPRSLVLAGERGRNRKY